MTGNLLETIRGLERYRTLIAVGIPILGGALVVAASRLTPRGEARGLLTGTYMLSAALGGAFLLVALAGLVMGVPHRMVIPLLVPGIVLTVIMGLFTPEIIREYQHFEARKLMAAIFRRS